MAPRSSRQDTGVPLREAYKLVAFGSELAEYEDLAERGLTWRLITVLGAPETETDRLFDRGGALREKFEQEIVEGLRRGEFVATARDTRLPVSSGRATIPADAWAFIEIDFFREKAVADGHDILDLRIRPNDLRQYSIRLERACEDWIRALSQAHPEKMLKEDAWERAQPLFRGLRFRPFERAWGRSAPEAWKKRGRPKTPR